MQDKAALRRAALARRRALTQEARDAAGRAIAEHLRPRLDRASVVAAYDALPTEPPTAEVLRICSARGLTVLLPVLLPDRDLDWVSVASGDPLGPDAVAGCDLVLVPALSVDRSGVRLGRGGGSYDRALSRVQGETIALLFDGELVDQLPTEPHDVRVTEVVTPSAGLTTCAG